MKSLLRSFVTAFSLYSAVPMPQVRWERDSMQYALCFFPLVGGICSLLLWGWGWLAFQLGMSAALFAVVATLLPLLVTGGIHLDGFIDTVDALSSHSGPERKLEIMKDPHVGAFGVIGCSGYLLLQFGLWYQVYQTPQYWILPLVGFVLSRALNALSIATFPCAKNSGLVYAFAEAAARRRVQVVCWCVVMLAAACSIYLAPVPGGAMVAAALLYFAAHRRFCIQGFGGNTGDLAGFLLGNVEMLCLAFAAIGGLVL